MDWIVLVLQYLLSAGNINVVANTIHMSCRPMENVIMKCNISNLGIDVKWIHNTTVYWHKKVYNRRISSQGRFDIIGNHEKGEYNLRMHITSLMDAGKYICSWFIKGQPYDLMTSEYQLKVNGSPLCIVENEEIRLRGIDENWNVVFSVYNLFGSLKVECWNAQHVIFNNCSMNNIYVENKSFITKFKNRTFLLTGTYINLTVDRNMLSESNELVIKVENIHGKTNCTIGFQSDDINMTATTTRSKTIIFDPTMKRTGLNEAVITVGVVLITVSILCLLVCRRYRRTVTNDSMCINQPKISEYDDAWNSVTFATHYKR